MATFNATNVTNNSSADVLNSSAATFLVPSTTTTAAGTLAAGTLATHPHLHLEQFGAMPSHAHYMSAAAATAPLPLNLPLQQHHHHHQQTNSSYTFVQIKREPCQVSEISSNNCHQPQQQPQHQQQQHQQHHHQQQHHHHHHQLQTASTSLGLGSVTSSSLTASATSKTMSASTLTTLVKIEASSPKVSDLEKSTSSTNNSVPIGIAVARKRPQEASSGIVNSGATLPLQQPLNKDMNCFGIRVTDLGATSCGNLYFTGNGDLMTTGTATAEELALSAAGINRAPSTFWQYPNALPIESVISMSPATVGLQYSRDSSRGQVVLLPATPAALDPFQQAAAAAAFVWPSAYIPQATTGAGPAAAAAAAAAALQPTAPNFIFPSMGAHSTLGAAPSYASTLQLYLAAAATATASANQQQTSSTTTTNSTINLSAGVTSSTSSLSSSSCSSLSSLQSSSSSSSRFLSLPAQPPTVTPKPLPMNSLLLPPTALKLEDYSVAQPLPLSLPLPLPLPLPLAEASSRDSEQQALNLMRLPTPPTSATMEPTASQLGQQVAAPHQILFQTAPSTPGTPALLNLSMHGAAAGAASGGIVGDTATPCDEAALNFKLHAPLTPQTPPRLGTTVLLPQMQDVNIQTDTPVCSEDENSSCPLKATQEAHESQLPLELTKPSESHAHIQTQANAISNANQPNECHTQTSPCDIFSASAAASSGQIEAAVPPPTTHQEQQQQQQQQQPLQQQQTSPEDLTGLVLLSNISTNSTPLLRVKQEPMEQCEALVPPLPMPEPPTQSMLPTEATPLQPLMDVEVEGSQAEPLGGLKLLCALAEQRIQEEVVQGSSLFATPTSRTPSPQNPHANTSPNEACSSPPATMMMGQQLLRSPSTFPSMQGIELPSTSSGAAVAAVGGEVTPVKRKKHKHSKSSSSVAGDCQSRKSSRCSKKSKKKRRHSLSRQQQQQQQQQQEPELQDEELQSELRSALHAMDPSYAQRFGQEVFNIMDNSMRMRLADMSRKYRKKKQKLEEISKHKKKKKCSKQFQLLQQQQPLQQSQPMPLQQPQLTLSSTLSNVLGTSSPLRDYKFPKFSSGNLQASSFLRFPDKTQSQTHSFPPPPPQQQPQAESSTLPNSSSSPSTTTSSSFVRLEPSALDAAVAVVAAAPITSSSSSSSSLKHSSYSHSAKSAARKERKLKANAADAQLATEAKRRLSAADAELQLTSEHLYRDETRVLTDMGGLFYAGVMKPLRPPDVYAITLDGERGNKSHVMSREDILKDTILEVEPKSVDSVPVGTRLCAYWSQQYRCLYPGRAIESEAAEDAPPVAVTTTTTSATPQDFVSVEFDDGDSGRIRLKNIRLLLSNYPIAEYNDNPLYSVGKQKRGALRSGDSGAGSASEHTAALGAEDGHSHHGFSMSSDNTTSLAATMELFTQRSEKKRLKKSMKKLSKAQNGIGQSTESNGLQHDHGDGEMVAPGDATCLDDGSRKHHKHKKRKKHKKHHRKNASEEAEPPLAPEYMTTTSTTTTQPELSAVGEMEDQSNTLAATQRVKVEIKVKAEQLDMEEETTSNLMSEVSDEVKGDDLVEHNNSKGSSKIAAFLPERQLWGWFGTAYRKAGVKGRARKQFYKTIKRGKETITVGDCAVFLSTGRPDRPYIGRIESMWETTAGNRVVRVAWFYHPEETTGCPSLKYPGALFESPHEDENDVQTISHRCEVLQFVSYVDKFGADSKQYQTIYDNNDTYYLAGHYNPRSQVLKLQDDIPTLEELQDTNSTTTTTITTTTTTTTTTED